MMGQKSRKEKIVKKVKSMTKSKVCPGRIVAFGNQKGGVTKTSTIVNLAASLSEMGLRTLVWDLDVNCGSTRLFGVPAGINVYGTYEVMTGDENIEDVIIQRGDLEEVNLPENVHLIAAHTRLEGIEAQLAAQLGPFEKPWEVLKKPLAAIKNNYDFIFLDTSPSMTVPTKAAYMAVEYFILTAVPERLAIEGLANAVRYIQHAWDSGNPDLKLMGVVMNQVPGRPTRLSRALLAEVDNYFSGGDEYRRAFKTQISSSTIVPTVQQGGKTLVEAAPDHKVTKQYRALAAEILERFERLEGPAKEPLKQISSAVSDDAMEEQSNG